jgi:hypothetical protein
MIPYEAKAYLRLYPTVAVPAIDTELDADELARKGNLRPMGRVSGYSSNRNAYGAIVYEGPLDGKLCHFTQLFLSREIWGVDASCVSLTHIRELYQQNIQEYKGKGYIASSYVEEVFTRALKSYLSFARESLQLPLPLQVEAGSFDAAAYEILGPFFDFVWKKCRVQRPPLRQAKLAQEFGGFL